MTVLRKPVRRVTTGEYAVVRVSKPSKVVVSLLPGDVLEFRELRRRKRYLLAVDTAFRHACRLHAQHEAALKPKRKRGGK
jgi:hypothetical protein